MKLWIEYEEDNGDDNGAARWGTLTPEQVDRVLAFAEEVCGRPDTLT